MRTIRIIEHITLDGVIQAPGGPDEDRDGAFEHGGWAFPHSDPAVGEAINVAQCCAGLLPVEELLAGLRQGAGKRFRVVASAPSPSPAAPPSPT